MDLDGDGVFELLLRLKHYESWSFELFRRAEGEWVRAYSGGGGGC